MSNNHNSPDPDHLMGMISLLYQALIFLISMCLLLSIGVIGYILWGDTLSKWWTKEPVVAQTSSASRPEDTPSEEDRIENGIHVATGLVVAEGFEVVRATCTACHSAKLVTQNAATREGWEEMIRWMQRTQGLWELGDQEDIILDYLAENYAPEEVGRRANLDLEEIEWYILEGGE
jgi:hypothetical protein